MVGGFLVVAEGHDLVEEVGEGPVGVLRAALLEDLVDGLLRNIEAPTSRPADSSFPRHSSTCFVPPVQTLWHAIGVAVDRLEAEIGIERQGRRIRRHHLQIGKAAPWLRPQAPMLWSAAAPGRAGAPAVPPARRTARHGRRPPRPARRRSARRSPRPARSRRARDRAQHARHGLAMLRRHRAQRREAGQPASEGTGAMRPPDRRKRRLEGRRWTRLSSIRR
jgi:hypothetical protein